MTPEIGAPRMLVIGKPVKNSNDRLRSFSLAEPVPKIQKDSGGVPSLRQPQQKTRHIQLMHRVNQAGQHSYSSPGNQNAGDPNASSELVKHEIAGYLEEEIAKKENSNQQSELLAANGQFLVHRQGGNPMLIRPR